MRDPDRFDVDVGDRDPRDCEDPFAPDPPIDELAPEERPVRRRAHVTRCAPRPPLADLTREQLECELAFGNTAMRQVLARAELERRGGQPAQPPLF